MRTRSSAQPWSYKKGTSTSVHCIGNAQKTWYRCDGDQAHKLMWWDIHPCGLSTPHSRPASASIWWILLPHNTTTHRFHITVVATTPRVNSPPHIRLQKLIPMSSDSKELFAPSNTQSQQRKPSHGQARDRSAQEPAKRADTIVESVVGQIVDGGRGDLQRGAFAVIIPIHIVVSHFAS